ncbi:MAG: hypothetical protein ACYC0V_19905 [Armatimonadota bacterium]
MVDKRKFSANRTFINIIYIMIILDIIVVSIFPINNSSMQESIIAVSILVLALMGMAFSVGLLKDRFEKGLGQLLMLLWGISNILGAGSVIVTVMRKGIDHAVVILMYICSMLILFVLPYSIGRWIVQCRKSQTGSSDNQCNKQAIG